MLRTHQRQFLDVCRQVKANESLRKIICDICPGGGKSAVPVIAAHELIPYIADGLCWVAPRDKLRDQAEEAFTEKWLQAVLGHSYEIRGRKNEPDLLLGKMGYATTYQTLVAARGYKTNPHVSLFNKKRMILVLDEAQHVAIDEEFFDACLPLKNSCAALVIMSGGLNRADNKRVAFLDYLEKDAKGRYFVDLRESATQSVVRYGLSDATRERAIIKINFELRDCAAGWDTEHEGGHVDEHAIDSFDGASRYQTQKALFTALDTEFFEALLAEAADFWRDRKRHNPRSTFLIIVPYIKHAERAARVLRQMGINAGIATSDEKDPQTTIDRFRGIQQPHLDALVTVAMAYEGMNAPAADVLACLTHIRSREWISQAIHRITRHDRASALPWEHQFATIFAPKDKFFLDIMAEIKAEQAPFVKETMEGLPPPPPSSSTKTRARQSALTDSWSHTFDDAPVAPDQHGQLTSALKAADIHGAISISSAKKFFEEMSGPKPELFTKDNLALREHDVATPTRREKAKRKRITEKQKEGYKPTDPASHARIERRGKAIWKIFHKRLEELTEAELDAVLAQQSIWMVP
jgi:superfamily II DNA or RNA helicase